MPFKIDEFLGVFQAYNLAIWPAQIIGYIIAAIALILVMRSQKYSNQFMSAIIALFWIWTGIVYHIIFFSRINKAAPAFGALFILQGILLFLYGAVHKRASFIYNKTPTIIIAYLFIAYATIGYPLLAHKIGHIYPRVPVFPLAPCPLTIFTFGALLLSKTKTPWYLWTIPFIWSIIGFTAALKLSMLEDFGLLIAGLTGTILIARSNRTKTENRIVIN